MWKHVSIAFFFTRIPMKTMANCLLPYLSLYRYCIESLMCPKMRGKEPQILSSTFSSTVRTKSIQLIKQRLAVFTGDFNDNNLFNHLNRSLINHRGRRHNLKLKRISRHIRTPIHRNNALNAPNQPLINTTIGNPRSRRNHNINRKTPSLSLGKMGCTATALA